jgi:hypothetical protein
MSFQYRKFEWRPQSLNQLIDDAVLVFLLIDRKGKAMSEMTPFHQRSHI